MKRLVYLLQLHKEKMISDEALKSEFHALRSPIENIDVEKSSKDFGRGCHQK